MFMLRDVCEKGSKGVGANSVVGLSLNNDALLGVYDVNFNYNFVM